MKKTFRIAALLSAVLLTVCSCGGGNTPSVAESSGESSGPVSVNSQKPGVSSPSGSKMPSGNSSVVQTSSSETPKTTDGRLPESSSDLPVSVLTPSSKPVSSLISKEPFSSLPAVSSKEGSYSEQSSPASSSQPASESPSVASSTEEELHYTTVPGLYTPFFAQEKVIAFTFDDGPDYWTPYILDFLEEKGEKATFFINGYRFETNPEFAAYVKRAHDLGCDIGSHGYYHDDAHNGGRLYTGGTASGYQASEAFIAETLLKNQEIISSITGEKTWLLRPPGGNFVRGRNYGYTVINWSVETLDDEEGARAKYGKQTYEEAANNVYNRAITEIRKLEESGKTGNIVLMHDSNKSTYEAFKRLYAELKAEGYRFVTVTELLGIDPSQTTGYYFRSSYIYGYGGKQWTRTLSGSLYEETFVYPFPVESPVLKKDDD